MRILWENVASSMYWDKGCRQNVITMNMRYLDGMEILIL